MATTSKRVLWKGAISFGLVHIPIALHSATDAQGLNFDWLDKRTMDPVGYKRVNKKTGKEIEKKDIVKGIEYEDGKYVVLSQEEIQTAYPQTTQTIEIESFVAANSIPFVYLERPYYISPINKGAKVYALLRETLNKTRKVGVAKVVIQTKQHLAVLIPSGPVLILNLLRWGDEIRTLAELDLPSEDAKIAGLTEKEIKMAEQLIDDMSRDWSPEEFTDSFKDQILQLVDEKIKAGDTETVTQLEQVDATESATIYDLSELLRRSLKGGPTVMEKKIGGKSGCAKSISKATVGKGAAKRTLRKSPSSKTSSKREVA